MNKLLPWWMVQIENEQVVGAKRSRIGADLLAHKSVSMGVSRKAMLTRGTDELDAFARATRYLEENPPHE